MDLAKALRIFVRNGEETLKPRTVANYKSAVSLLADFGIITTKDLTRPRLAEWVESRRKLDVSATSINTQLGGVLSIASFLERRGRFPLVRLRGLRRLRIPLRGARPAPAFLSREQFARLRIAALGVDPQLELAVMLSVFAGLRLAESIYLTRDNLRVYEVQDVERPFIHVVRAFHNRRPRSVPIAKAFAAELRSRDLQPGALFLPTRENDRSRREGVISDQTMKRWLRDARDAAGLFHVTWFTLRHCFGSWCRQNNIEISKVAGWMGNTVKVCEAHYAALAPGGDIIVEQAFRDEPGAA